MNELGLCSHVIGVFRGIGRVDHVHLQQRQKGGLNVPETESRSGLDTTGATQSAPWTGQGKDRNQPTQGTKNLETAVPV